MKKSAIFAGIATCILSITLLLGTSVAAKNRTFTGEIMDSQCAKTSRLHPMMNRAGNHVTPKECTLKCVKELGSVYVLYDPATKEVYQLDEQLKFDPFAGGTVKVTGTLDDATKTIHVVSIKGLASKVAH